MDRNEFWQIVDSTKEASGEDLRGQYQLIVSRLSEKDPREILEFQDILGELLVEAYRWDLWGAARLLNAGCSNDGFQDFRRWLISRGKRVYMDALADPDSLADSGVSEGGASFESFGWVAGDAYKIRTGRDITSDVARDGAEKAATRMPREPVGDRWRPEDLQKLFPRIYRKYVGNE